MSKLLRRGHAPGFLRDAFCQFLDEYWESDTPLPVTIEVGGAQETVKWLIGQLWHCTDILPAVYADMLELKRYHTYAAAMRKVSEQIKSGE